MADSAFCLILPGNSQSSQRLTEAFLTGCIPVFIGPPWHSLPLTQKVPALPGLELVYTLIMHTSWTEVEQSAWGVLGSCSRC